MNTDMPEFNSSLCCVKCGYSDPGFPMVYRFEETPTAITEWMDRSCPACSYVWREKLPVLDPATA